MLWWPCRVRTCMAQGGWQEDNPIAMALVYMAVLGQLQERGLSQVWGHSKNHPAREVRLLGTQPSVPGRAPAC